MYIVIIWMPNEKSNVKNALCAVGICWRVWWIVSVSIFILCVCVCVCVLSYVEGGLADAEGRFLTSVFKEAFENLEHVGTLGHIAL